MSGTSMPTVDTAPRDLATLTSQGVFVHRRLAENLHDLGFKIWSTEKEKAAFLTATGQDRAAALFEKLKEYDSSNGGAPAAAAPAVAPAAAPAAVPETSKRNPRTVASAAAVPAATPAASSNGSTSGNVAELLLSIKSVQDELKKLNDTIVSEKGLVKSVGINMSSLNDVKAMVSASIKVQNLMLGLLCLFGQQVLGGVAIEEFVPAAVEDANKALEVLEASGAGKG